MLQVKNETPFVPGIAVLPDATGVDTLVLAVKATFAIQDGAVRVAEDQAPLVPADEPTGVPGESSLRYAGELHLPKPATDVVVVSDAYAPRGVPVAQFGVLLSVGKLRKSIAVFGDREWVGAAVPTPSAPVPTAQVPVVWERAYGGSQDLGGGNLVAEMRNPVGVGFRGNRSAAEMRGTPLPNLEDLRARLGTVHDRPPPAGLGFIAPHWQPRASFAGTYDARWQDERAPLLPRDFDRRFFNAAAPGLVASGYLRGDEQVTVSGVTAEGGVAFALPGVPPPAVRVARAGEDDAVVETRLDTVILDTDAGQVFLLWRGQLALRREPLEVRAIQVRPGGGAPSASIPATDRA